MYKKEYGFEKPLPPLGSRVTARGLGVLKLKQESLFTDKGSSGRVFYQRTKREHEGQNAYGLATNQTTFLTTKYLQTMCNRFDPTWCHDWVRINNFFLK